MNILLHYNHMNYCPECFGDNLIHDFHRSEFYCGDCGLVVLNYEFHNLMDYTDYLEDREEKFKQYLKTNPLPYNQGHFFLSDLLDAIHKEIEEKKKLKKTK